MSVRSLFLSYDGMTDPLGGSQVIPYLRGLAAKGHSITIVSAEKPERYEAHRAAIGALLAQSGISWEPVMYHKRPPIFSTLWDLRALRAKAFAVARSKKIEIVHCRSYVPALVGLSLKRELGIRFLFDMRGFWADERVDGGLWNQKRLPYRMAYRFFKKKETSFLNESDRTVSLTHAGREEMRKWPLAAGAVERIEVIPCCADLEHFRRDRVNEAERAKFSAELGIKGGDFVVSYLGSLGTWYLLDEMLQFFAQLKKSRPQAKLLFITPDDPAWVRSSALRMGVSADSICIREGKRSEVPALLSLSQLGLFFIKPSYSKISSSPTKLAELLAMGLPVITNSGVGDSDWIAQQYRVGKAVKGFTEADFAKAIEALPEVLAIPENEIRAAAQSYFSLEKGVEAYDRIYTALGGELK